MANTRYYEYALMVEQHGGFKRAAIECGVSQPALSKGIAALEKELGGEIFDRNSRPLVPTVYGQSVIEEAKQILEGQARLKKNVLQLKGVLDYEVRMAFGPFMWNWKAASISKAFREQYPSSCLMLQSCAWDVLPQLLHDRKVDLFVGDISDEGLEEHFVLIPLPNKELYYISSPNNPLAGKDLSSHPAEFLQHPFVCCSAPPWAQRALKKLMPDFDPRETHASIYANDLYFIRDVLLNDPDLATLAPQCCFQDEIEKGDLVASKFHQDLKTHAGIAYNRYGSQLPILQDVVELVKEVVISGGDV